MSKSYRAKVPPSPASTGNSAGPIEASVRQLMANGNFRTALESAKQFHKAQGTSASEHLLVEAYAARIQSLIDQNLALEAKSLLGLVRERFPSAKDRLDALRAATAGRDGDYSALLTPLNDPELSRERRAAIELVVQTQLTDLKSLAGCSTLPSDHPLRQAAAALDRAFTAVTTGPVTLEQIALPEVSHRSPLASWKLLIHAIAAFHRGDDEAALNHIESIRPESVPARLAPAMRVMLGARELEGARTGGKTGTLKPSELSLISRSTENWTELRKALVNLDRAFDDEENIDRIFKAVRAAIKECRLRMPDQLGKLRQLITVRAGVEYMDTDRLASALEGTAREDADYFRMYARAMEGTGEVDDLGEACELWHEFGVQAVREGWFRANSVEAATLYLHMAGLLRRIPSLMLLDLQDSYVSGRQSAGRKMSVDDRYFLFPDELYRRACQMDPHPEAFAQWMLWAAGRSATLAEKVALDWHQVRPDDIEPILHLMHGAEKRNAFQSALSYLAKAERIDAVHPSVRAARLRLLTAGVMRHLQQKKPHLAKQKLAAIAMLPQSQQGDRPALVCVLRYLTAVADRDGTAIAETRLELETLMGDRLVADLLIYGLGTALRNLDPAYLPSEKDLGREEGKALPASLTRVMAIADDVGLKSFKVLGLNIDEVAKQFPGVCHTLALKQIQLLAELGVAAERPRLAWDASQAGMERGGPTEAYFLLLRALAPPPGSGPRSVVVAAAAAELGRFHRDMEVVGRAVEMVRNPMSGDSLSLTLEDAREVLRTEIDSSAFPTRFNPGPDYSRFLPGSPCDCPDCRRKRGHNSRVPGDGYGDPSFEIEELEKSFEQRLPKGMPPAVAQEFLELLRERFRAGEGPDEVMSRIFGEAGGNRARGKSAHGRSKERRDK